jgi:hypothetical protein
MTRLAIMPPVGCVTRYAPGRQGTLSPLAGCVSRFAPSQRFMAGTDPVRNELRIQREGK